MDNEKFQIVDAKAFTTDKGDTLYYINVYSSFEILEKVFLKKSDYEYVLANNASTDITEHLHRVYNRAKNAFVIKFVRE